MPNCQPVTDESIDRDIAKLRRCEHTDYLFLARREKSFLSDLPAVYEPGTYENLKWLYWQGITRLPIVALFLHVTKVLDARPVGSVTLLDYQESARDVESFSALGEAEREKHSKDVVKHYTAHIRYCTILDVIQYLETGEVKTAWT